MKTADYYRAEVDGAGRYYCGHNHRSEDRAKKCLERQRTDMPALWHTGYITRNGQRADGTGTFRE